jgi:hypothetical protein
LALVLIAFLKAEDLLRPTPTGTFLIRLASDSSSFVLSIKGSSDFYRHIKVDHDSEDNAFLVADDDRFKTIPELVDFYTGSGDVSGVLLGNPEAVLKPYRHR